MTIIEKSIILNVPAEIAFRYISDPSHLTELCQNMVNVSDIEMHLPSGAQFAWVYKMVGAHMFGEAAYIETKHNQQFDMHFRGGIHADIVWQFQPVSDGVLLQVKLDYLIPPPLLKKHSEDAILSQNEDAVEHMLTNLKTMLDAHHARIVNRM